MKKVLVAGAALLLVGGMAASAMAEVNLSGDARVRWVYKDKYGFGNDGKMINGQWKEQDATNYFDSRFRVKVKAKAKGGAYMKARIRMDDFKWNGQGWGASSEKKNIWVDYAYLGIPMGPVELVGGQIAWTVDTKALFYEDERPSMLLLQYKGDDVKAWLGYEVMEDFVNDADDVEDNNERAWHFGAEFKATPDWTIKAYGMYVNDQRDWNETVNEAGETVYVRREGDNSGFKGTAFVDGKVGALGLYGQIAYKNSDVQGTKNDGWAGIAEVSYDMGALTPAVQIGFTQDSYVAGGDFGWVMLGSIYPTGVLNVGASSDSNDAGTDWQWIAPTVTYAVSEDLKLTGNFVWVSVDTNDDTLLDSKRLANLTEISGKAEYTVSEGAKLVGLLGWLIPDFDGRLDSVGVQDDNAFGGMLKMVIKY